MFNQNGTQFETVEELVKDVLDKIGASLKKTVPDFAVRNPLSWLRVIPNTTSTVNMGITSATVGTPTAKPISFTNEYTATPFVEYLQAAGGNAGWRYGQNTFYRSNVAHRGGFKWTARFGLATGNDSVGKRFIAGFNTDLGWTSALPSAILNTIFVAFDPTDGNFQVMHNGASGTANKVNIPIPVDTTNRANAYEVTIVSLPNNPNVTVTLTRLGATPLIFSHTITDQAKLPAVNLLISPKIQRYDTNATTQPLGVAIGDMAIY